MTTSSAPTVYSTTLNDTIGITAQEIGTILGNITMSTTGSNYYTNSGTVSTSTITTGSGLGISNSATITLSNIGTPPFVWKDPEEFVDAFPDFNRIKKMCDEYPGLRIAYEKFKTTYKLVKDHYDTPEDQRPLP